MTLIGTLSAGYVNYTLASEDGAESFSESDIESSSMNDMDEDANTDYGRLPLIRLAMNATNFEEFRRGFAGLEDQADQENQSGLRAIHYAVWSGGDYDPDERIIRLLLQNGDPSFDTLVSDIIENVEGNLEEIENQEDLDIIQTTIIANRGNVEGINSAVRELLRTNEAVWNLSSVRSCFENLLENLEEEHFRLKPITDPQDSKMEGHHDND